MILFYLKLKEIYPIFLPYLSKNENTLSSNSLPSKLISLILFYFYNHSNNVLNPLQVIPLKPKFKIFSS